MLHDIQQSFLHDIYQAPDPYARKMQQFLAPTMVQRLDIYISNARLGLIETLQNTYPVTRQVVGDDFFKTLAQHYMDKHKPAYGDRHKFGDRLAAFLADYLTQHNVQDKLNYLPELAALEWAVHLAACAYAPPPLDFAQLTAYLSADATAIISPMAHISLIPYHYNSADIWRAHQKPPFENINLQQVKGTLLIYRAQNHDIIIEEADTLSAHFIRMCADNIPLTHIITQLAEQHETPAIQEMLAHMITVGLNYHE